MLAIIKKELRLFFGSTIAYFVIGGFLLINGLLLWVFKNDFNILNAGFADLTSFFNTIPWLFILLIPAITMKSFPEEINSGTIEILKTKPISNFELIFGKYAAYFITVCIAIIPTLFYLFSIHSLANPVGNIDFGLAFGSYIGLFFIASAYISISLWVATFSNNQLVVLLASIVISYFAFYGIYSFSDLFSKNSFELQQLAMYPHFESIGRGVIDTRDLIYFISISSLFLVLAHTRMARRKSWKPFIYTLLLILLTNGISKNNYLRFDLTADKRYTLSETSLTILDNIDEAIVVKVYLEGDFPSEFKRLQIETQQLLIELKSRNKQIKTFFINPKNDLQQLIKKGLSPSRLTIEENGTVSESVILPWATIHYKNKIEKVSLLKDAANSDSQQQQLEKSIQNLEFSFLDGIKKVTSNKEKSIAILSGNGELDDLHLFSLLKTLGSYYHLAKFTLDSVATNPLKTFEQLNTYDLAIIAKPTIAFTEEEKFILDQYTMQGGKSLWMIDHVFAEMDSLYKTGKSLSYPKDLNLDDYFFRYGARINHNIVKDLYSAKISLATGNTGNKTNFENYLWHYHPLVTAKNNHPIITNLGGVQLKFPSNIDLLKNDIQKTPILETSVLSKVEETLNFIELKSVAENPDPKIYNHGKQTLGLLLEGSFTSAYKDRQKPLQLPIQTEKGIPSKMILIADGDIASNQVHKGKPLELGINKWTQEIYANKDFLLNAVDYLLDDSGLIALRSKKITLRSLDKSKIIAEGTKWKLLNTLIPVLLISVLGIVYGFIRKRKYR
jgi:ABC-2 type transport system permease protein